VYVYLIYGMHYCLNFTTDKEKAGAVLIRWIKDFETWKNYDGPWKTTKFLWIDKSFNWLDLEKTDKIEIYDIWTKIEDIEVTPRIGISKAKDKLWRFIVKEK
jgi:DNA-3-methyladenine glycosylase